jgi:chromosome segregation ATPase
MCASELARALCLCAALLPVASSAAAQQPSHERDTIRRFQQQSAKLQQENTRLQQDNAALGAKLKQAEAERDRLNAQAAKLRKSSRALQAAQDSNAQLRAQLAAGEEKLREARQQEQRQLNELRAQLEQARTEVAQSTQRGEQQAGTLRAGLQQQQGRADACERKNQQLYTVTTDLIARYKTSRGAWEKLLLSEPFTGLKSVEVENLLDDMRDRARDAKVTGDR